MNTIQVENYDAKEREINISKLIIYSKLVYYVLLSLLCSFPLDNVSNASLILPFPSWQKQEPSFWILWPFIVPAYTHTILYLCFPTNMYPYKAVENDHYLQKSKELFKIFSCKL